MAGFCEDPMGEGNFASLDNVTHPARRLLMHYKHRQAPVKFSTAPWTSDSINQAIERGPHRSCDEYIDFLEEKFVDMIQKGQWGYTPCISGQTITNYLWS
jgi:hypothetical protein